MSAADRPAPSVFAALRSGYGVLLVAMPATMVSIMGGAQADRRSAAVARVLGVRQIVQGAVTAGRPGPAVLALGAEVDVAHSVSMLALAMLDRTRRRTALVDASVAGTLAVAGTALALGRRRRAPAALHPVGQHRQARWSEWREALAGRVARIALPAPLRSRVVGLAR